MKAWIVECEEKISALSRYVVASRNKKEAEEAVKNQVNRKIIDKPKTVEEEIEVLKITSTKEITLS